MFNYLLAILLAILPLGTRLILRQGPFEYATLFVSVIGILILLVVAYAWSRRTIRRPPWPAALLIIWSLISIFWSPDRMIALQHAIYLALAIGLYATIARSGATKQSQWPLYGFLTGAVIQSLLAAWQFVTQRVVASTILGVSAQTPAILGTPVIEVGGERILRAFGTFPHPNILGGYLAIAGVLALIALARETRPRYARFLEFCFLFVQAGLILSFSRGAWLAFAIGVLVLLLTLIYPFQPLSTLINPSLKRVLPIIAISIALAAISFFRFPEFFRARLTEGRLNTISTTERSLYASDARDRISQHPVLGVGGGNFSIATALQSPGRPDYAYQPVHNTFALVLAELGPIGLALLVAVFAIMLCSMIAAPIGLALLVLAASDHYLWSLSVGMLLFWVSFGLVRFLSTTDT